MNRTALLFDTSVMEVSQLDLMALNVQFSCFFRLFVFFTPFLSFYFDYAQYSYALYNRIIDFNKDGLHTQLSFTSALLIVGV